MVERGSQLNVDPFPYPRTALSAMSERRSQDGGDEDLAMITDEAELGVRVDPAPPRRCTPSSISSARRSPFWRPL